MISTRTAVIIISCGLLAACAGKPPGDSAPDPSATGSPSQAETASSTGSVSTPASGPSDTASVDGAYHGTSTRFRAARRDCAHPGLVTLYVQNRQFAYRWDRLIDVDAIIQPDGTVQGQGPGIVLQGHLDGDAIEGDVTSAACSLHFTVQKRF